MPFNTRRTLRTVSEEPALERALRLHLRGSGILGQGEAGGPVQGAGILRRDHHSASGGAGAAGVGEGAKERADLRLKRRRAGG
jgi:hypothetical protein